MRPADSADTGARSRKIELRSTILANSVNSSPTFSGPTTAVFLLSRCLGKTACCRLLFKPGENAVARGAQSAVNTASLQNLIVCSLFRRECVSLLDLLIQDSFYGRWPLNLPKYYKFSKQGVSFWRIVNAVDSMQVHSRCFQIVGAEQSSAP